MGAFFRQSLSVWLLAGLALLVGGCAVLGPKPNADLGRQQLQRADQLIKSRQYQDAAEQLELAVINLPSDGQAVLRYGEVLEVLDNVDGAARAYRQALSRDSEEVNELRYRLGLLQALFLNQVKKAAALQNELPADSFEALDLHGVILLSQGQPRQALIQFAQLAKATRDEDQTAHLAYHAALAYLALNSNDDAFRNLYQAINHAKHLGLIHQIQGSWNQLQPGTKLSDQPKS